MLIFLLNFDHIFSGFSQNAALIFLKLLNWIRHAVSSKVQGTVKVRKFKKVRNLNSAPILFCNPVRVFQFTNYYPHIPCINIVQLVQCGGVPGWADTHFLNFPKFLRTPSSYSLNIQSPSVFERKAELTNLLRSTFGNSLK